MLTADTWALVQISLISLAGPFSSFQIITWHNSHPIKTVGPLAFDNIMIGVETMGIPGIGNSIFQNRRNFFCVAPT